MRRWPRTIAGGAILLLLAGVAISHLLSMAVYHADLGRQLDASADQQLIERMAVAVRGMTVTAPAERDRAAQAFSWPSADIHWTAAPLVKAMEPLWAELKAMQQRGRQAFPDLPADGLRLAYDDAGGGDAQRSRHLLLASVRLADGSWVNFAITKYHGAGAEWTPLLASTTIMVALVTAVALLLVRRWTRPLARLAGAAQRLGVDVSAPPLPDEGPEEVREASRAFNEMQARLRRLIEDRTQMMAAMSHDLRTPITRMRLRTEFVEDEHERQRMLADLNDMEAMITSTLAFLRQDNDEEQSKLVDVASILASLCTDQADLGHAARYLGCPHARIVARPLALKRAFANLIDNALKYGQRADVRLVEAADELRLSIGDQGPGLPSAELERVFQPYYRAEGSRSRETGGVGLGLPIARDIIRAHGGDVSLRNRPEGGLEAVVTLPRIAPDGAGAAAIR